MLDSNEGMVPRVATYLFHSIENSTQNARVKISIIDLYREQIQDLLDDAERPPSLRVRESPAAGIYIENLIKRQISSGNECKQAVEEALQRKNIQQTKMSYHSSQYHIVVTFYVEFLDTEGSISSHSSITLAKLAGSERLKDTVGTVLQEAKVIHHSLRALNHCTHAILNRDKFVPYRDSKLSRILQSSLKEKNVSWIFLVSPFSQSENVRATLARANNITKLSKQQIAHLKSANG
uniref:Kinesin motor domain-containing protein n=1 Tax=Vannella robusta TaxID=1487602 RepID=A0A7S4IAV1_9EUKA|mmetsp:Transcript_22878/g.29185  ORF Transcript_22878/g.29185 Transcript_22878/m.29185 type:complete len:236 (+) Transcript_22878:324-1031(+)